MSPLTHATTSKLDVARVFHLGEKTTVALEKILSNNLLSRFHLRAKLRTRPKFLTHSAQCIILCSDTNSLDFCL